MGHTVVVWKILEELLTKLRKQDIQIPTNILEDLRTAKSLIEISYSTNAPKETIAKIEAYTTNVEAYLINQAQKSFDPNTVDEWLKRIEYANSQIVNEKTTGSKNQFVVGVPRGQPWIRIETNDKLSEEYVSKLAEKWHLTVNKQTDDRLMIHGQLNDIKTFIKQITASIT
ncbi:MAG: DUF2096 domain-containing protein [Nitrososphaerota archaeon]|jgi:hypothetical protein|nr:DUF2096 domain-containing protein [Nitrososphaerota archaeon]